MGTAVLKYNRFLLETEYSPENLNVELVANNPKLGICSKEFQNTKIFVN